MNGSAGPLSQNLHGPTACRLVCGGGLPRRSRTINHQRGFALGSGLPFETLGPEAGPRAEPKLQTGMYGGASPRRTPAGKTVWLQTTLTQSHCCLADT
jgi:hypothetical protein